MSLLFVCDNFFFPHIYMAKLWLLLCIYKVGSNPKLIKINNQSKGKASPQHFSLNDQNHRPKSKAIWDQTTTKLFIDACLEQVIKGERSERTLLKKGWRDAIDWFCTISERIYNIVQLRNKWDSLRNEWVV